MTSNPLPKDVATVLCTMVTLCAVLAIWVSGIETVESEAGLVEAMSTLVLAASVVLFVWRVGPKNARGVYWYATVVLLFLLARECDLDKMLFRQGVLSLKHYSGAAPLWQKAVGLVIVAALLSALITLARRGMRPFLRGVFARAPWAWLIVAAIGLMVSGKMLDGLGRKLSAFGYQLSVSGHELAQYGEELAELGAEMCVLLAVVRMPYAYLAKDQNMLRADHAISSP